jgi:hypothetical protein
MFGSHREEIIGGWRILHNEELNNFCCPHNIRVVRVMKSRNLRWARHVSLTGQMKPEGKKSFG